MFAVSRCVQIPHFSLGACVELKGCDVGGVVLGKGWSGGGCLMWGCVGFGSGYDTYLPPVYLAGYERMLLRFWG